MGQVKIVTGPSASGKTEWARRWVAEDPAYRRYVGNMAAGVVALQKGFDVVMDLEEIARHEVEVVKFSA